MKRGLFITFEGGEGSGKTTQITRLANDLREKGQDVIVTREPGGTPEAEKIRDLLVRRDGGAWTPMAEIMLLFAARVQHVETLIRPALAAGKIVLCDRFTDSTRAYQGYGHGVPLEAIEAIAETALGGFSPDLTIVFDIAPEAGLRRVMTRTNSEDRFEKLDMSFHQRMREGYLAIARNAPGRCMVIEAAGTIEEIAADIAKKIQLKLPA